MNEPEYFKCACTRCGGHIEFPAEAVGMVVSCPHCGQSTGLFQPPAGLPKEIPAPRGKAVRWILVVALLGLAGGGGFVYFQSSKSERNSSVSSSSRAPTNPLARIKPLETTNASAVSSNNLRIGKITLEKTKNSSVVYAVGDVKNESGRQRFGLKIELDLLDSDGERIGTATDYLSILEPRQDWRFKALVLEGKAVSARLGAIREDP